MAEFAEERGRVGEEPCCICHWKTPTPCCCALGLGKVGLYTPSWVGPRVRKTSPCHSCVNSASSWAQLASEGSLCSASPPQAASVPEPLLVGLALWRHLSREFPALVSPTACEEKGSVFWSGSTETLRAVGSWLPGLPSSPSPAAWQAPLSVCVMHST